MRVPLIVLLTTVLFAQGSGPYLGQGTPGPEPRLFAPGFLCTALQERDVVFSPDGMEAFSGLMVGGVTLILHSRLEGGRWTPPAVASFSAEPGINCLEPAFTPDGQRLYFLSTRPRVGETASPGWTNQHIWYVARQADGTWGRPQDPGAPLNGPAPTFFPSFTRDGVCYFTKHVKVDGKEVPEIWRAVPKDGTYVTAEPLPPQVNHPSGVFNAWIAPDESYLLAGMAEPPNRVSPKGPEYVVFFRSPAGTWSGPVNLGKAVNLPNPRNLSQSLSPDGRILFFSATRGSAFPADLRGLPLSALQAHALQPGRGNSDIYWMDAAFIQTLRPAGF